MKHIKNVQAIIDLIEKNIKNPISVKEMAQQSGMSNWQFQRVFSSMVGHSIGEYIRRRRLTLAAEKLLNSEDRILDIAIEFQFNSQEAFSRPFKAMFGDSPARYREKKPSVILEKRIEITPAMLSHLNGGIELVPEILEMPAQKFVGVKCSFENHLNPGSRYNEVLVPIWLNFVERISEISNRIGSHAVGIAICDSNKIEDETLNYLAAVQVDSFSDIPEGMVTHEMPISNYAKFTNSGAGEMTWYTANYIYGTWLPGSGYRRAQGDDYELFDERYRIGDDSSISDYYLPIVKNS